MGKAELDSSVDYYRILEITFPSTQVDIRRAFLELARTQHPDKNPGREIEFKAKFQAITTAYDVLKDPTLKRTYDQIRPVARKPAATPKFTASSKPSPATAKAASEAAARASAFPRQAKANFKATPKSPPKKSQTQRKDPFFDWTPPIPTNKPAASKPAPRPEPTYHKDHLNGAAAGSQAYSTPRRAPTAARTSAFSATREPPLKTQEPTAGFKPTIPHRSKPDLKKKKTQPTNAQANEPSERGWWAQSATAYSTFNAATSKYSPYAADTSPPSRPFPSDAYEKHSRANPGQQRTDPRRSSPPSASQAEGAHETPREADYSWQNSRGAYQQRNVDPLSGDARPVKQPRRRRPVNVPGGPTTFSTAEPGRDSNLNNGTESRSGAGTEPSTQSPISDAKETNPKGADLPESSDSDDESIACGTSSESDSDSDASWTFTTRKKRAEKTKTEEEALPSRRVFHKFRPALSTPDGPSVAPSVEGFTASQSDRYSFTFRPSPVQSVPGSTSSRKSSGTVPYVHLSKVPDFNFTSPTAQSESPGPLPFSTTKVQIKSGDTSPVSEGKTKEVDAKASQSPSEKSDATGSLADQFSRFDLRDKSSPLKFSFAAHSPEVPKRAEEAASKDWKESATTASISHSHDSDQPNTQQNPFSFERPTTGTESAKADYMPSFNFPKPTLGSSATFFSKHNQEHRSTTVPPIFSFNFAKATPDQEETIPVNLSTFSKHSTSIPAPVFRFSDLPVADIAAVTSDYAPQRPFIFGAGFHPPLPPWDYLKKDNSIVDTDTYRRDYLAESAIFERYFEAWREYRTTTTWNESYRVALATYQEVREAHEELEKQHLINITSMSK